MCNIIIAQDFVEQNRDPKINDYNRENLSKFLSLTEDIRLTNTKVFNINLKKIESIYDELSFENQCFYNYLKSYQLSYKGLIKKAKSKLTNLQSSCKGENITIRILSLLANISAISGDYQKAIIYLDAFIDKLGKVENTKTRHIGYTSAIIVYYLFDQSRLSIKFADLMISEDPEKKLLCKTHVYRLLANFRHNKIKEVEKQVRNTVTLCKQEGQVLYGNILYVTWLSKIMRRTSNTKELNEIYNQLLSIDKSIDQTEYKNLISIKNSLYAQLFEKKGNYPEAIKFANLAIMGSISIGDTEQKLAALEVLINHYQKIGDYKKANKFLIEKNKSENKYYSDKQAKLMAYQTVKHNNLANNYKIKSLSQANKVLQLENEIAEKSKTNQRLISSLMGSLLVFSIFLLYRFKRQQQKFKKLSELDHMTLVYKRKGLRDFMDYLLPYQKKKKETVGFAIFDLDLFKKVNDKYGHVVGDWVIKKVIDVCKELENDKVVFARLGGEEFAIVMRDSHLQELSAFSEQCRQAIMDIVTKKGTGFDFSISASFGITTTKQSDYNYGNLMQHADTALYQSKENGRNQISCYN